MHKMCRCAAMRGRTILSARRVCFAHIQRKNYFKLWGILKSLRAFQNPFFHRWGRKGCSACFLRKRWRCGKHPNPLSLCSTNPTPPKGGALGITAKLPVSPEALPLGELSPQVTERASTPTDKTAGFLHDTTCEKRGCCKITL